MDKVSVIIPVYNKELYIERSIKSVLAQNYENFELIVVDDGSKDNSKIKILEMQKIDSRVKYLYKENGGVSSARNYGIKNATGSYISFLDADDTYEVDFLGTMIKSINKNNSCYSGNNFIDFDGKKKKNIRNNYSEGNVIFDYLAGRITPHTNSWLIRKKFILDNNLQFLNNLSWGEDFLFFSKLLLHDNRVVSVKECLTNHYRDIPNSLSSSTLEKIEDDLIWMDELKKYILQNFEISTNIFKVMKVLDGYRKPGVIIYRLNKFYNSSNDNHEVLKYFKKYEKEIDGINYSNGLRSIKLLFELVKLKLNILMIKRGRV